MRVLSCVPLCYAAGFVVLVVLSEPRFVDLLVPVHLGVIALSIVLIVITLRDIARNRHLSDTTRRSWTLLVLALGAFSILLYWNVIRAEHDRA